jgi:hypothetical protein
MIRFFGRVIKKDDKRDGCDSICSHPGPGTISCIRCKNLGERIDDHNFCCDHPSLARVDHLGLRVKPACSYANASRNCNGFESKKSPTSKGE